MACLHVANCKKTEGSTDKIKRPMFWRVNDIKNKVSIQYLLIRMTFLPNENRFPKTKAQFIFLLIQLKPTGLYKWNLICIQFKHS